MSAGGIRPTGVKNRKRSLTRRKEATFRLQATGVC